jgi:hypothetical protein
MEPDEMTYYHLKEIKMADKIMSQMRRMKNKKKVSAMDTGKHGAEIFEN